MDLRNYGLNKNYHKTQYLRKYTGVDFSYIYFNSYSFSDVLSDFSQLVENHAGVMIGSCCKVLKKSLQQILRYKLQKSKSLLMQSHCSSSIVTKGFGSIVSPLFYPAFAGSFPHFIYKEVPVIFRKSTFSQLFHSIFSPLNTVMYCLLVPNTFEIQS